MRVADRRQLSEGCFSVFDRAPTTSDEPADEQVWVARVARESIRLAYAALDEGLSIFVALDEDGQVHLLCRHNAGGSTSSEPLRSIVERGASVTVEGNHLGWFAYGAVADDVSAVLVDSAAAVLAHNVFVSRRAPKPPSTVTISAPSGERVIELPRR